MLPGQLVLVENGSLRHCRLLPQLLLLRVPDPFLEQQGIYNATNFIWTDYDPYNITIAGVKIATLACPSDPWQPTVISSSTPYASFVENVMPFPGHLVSAVHELRRQPGNISRHLPVEPTERPSLPIITE